MDLIYDIESSKYFEFDAGDDDKFFVVLNPIIIVEKLGDY